MIVHGSVIYQYADGTRQSFPAAYYILSNSYKVLAGHGLICPWTLGGQLAKARGIPIVEILFFDPEEQADVELYVDDHGLWTVGMGELLRRLAPVNIHELMEQHICQASSSFQAEAG